MLKEILAGTFLAGVTAFCIGMAVNYDPNTSTFVTPKSVSKMHKKYLESNQPQLYMFHESVSFQIRQCNENLKRLNSLKRVLTNDNSQKILLAKQNQILSQKQKLTTLMDKINSEIEVGMINLEFNSLDQGGMRQEHLSEIIKEGKVVIDQAQHLNQAVAHFQK